ncbi:MAG: transporter ATP-binding protein [Rhodospirillales bacterium]|nr:transporter ATP-binding protein [Rhodospirillales bacterium]
MMTGDSALIFDHVDVTYRVGGRDRRVLTDLNFQIARGEAYGLVGESGSGKSTAAFAAVRYLARNGLVSSGNILIDGRDLMALSPGELRQLRSHAVSMVYQDPTRALNPSIRIGRQMAEVFEAAGEQRANPELARVADMLGRVQIANPRRVMEAYPHELSGGMQQRVVIAMALSTNPALLILDEPTTALDATVEAEILELIATLRAEFSIALLFISHSLRVIAQMCDRVGVLYAGELVEEGPANTIFDSSRHPYTVGLLRCLPGPGLRKDRSRLETIAGFPPPPGTKTDGCIFAPRCSIATGRCQRETPPMIDLGGRSTRCHYPERAADMPHVAPDNRSGEGNAIAMAMDNAPLLQATNLSKTFTGGGGNNLRAVNAISLDLRPGETLGIIGESGSGKSTLAKLLLGLTAADPGGTIIMNGEPLPARTARRSPAQLKALQMIFQNPGSALNRAQTVRRLIGRSLRKAGLSGAALEDRLRTLANNVRLTIGTLDEKPRSLSGGMQQRVAIARAFAGEPRIVVCDEPTSALDVSVQAAILNLLADLQAERNVSYLFISHDLNVVHYLADRIAVLYLGRLVEIGPTDAIFAGPRHPYTEALLTAGTAHRVSLTGEIPSAANLPSACVFQTRCPRKIGRICEEQEPQLITAGDGHEIRCHIPADELKHMQT